jgi:hypothetical protein
VASPAASLNRPWSYRARGPVPVQASFTIAMIIPINTNSTIAACSQIQVGDIWNDRVLCTRADRLTSSGVCGKTVEKETKR